MKISATQDSTRDGDRQGVSERQKFVWNMIGSMSNALASFVLLTMVTRFNGAADGGLFSLAFSTAQLLASVGCFETRAIQATDVKHAFKFEDYFTFRLLTSILMMLCLIVYVIVNGKTGVKAAVMFFICLYKAIDCMSDSFQGLFQLEDRIDLSGKALGIRVILSAVVFGITLAVTHDMLLGAILMCIFELVFIRLFDYRISTRYERCALAFHPDALKSLFLQCLPLFIGSFMFSYVVNASKYAIDANLTEELQNYYGFLLMPAFVINLFSLFVFRPMLTKLALCWSEADVRGFLAIVRKALLWISFLTVASIVGAYLLGPWVLGLFSGLDFKPFRMQLVYVMLGGAMNAVITVLYYVLTVMRRQRLVLVGYTVGFVAALILPPILVRAWQISGAVFGYVLPMTAIVIAFAIMAWVCIGKVKALGHGQG